MVSPNLRVLAIDDGPFAHRVRARVPIIGVLTRGAQRIETVCSTAVVRDGWHAAEAMASMIATNELAHQARCVLLDGVAVGGFNIVDVAQLASDTSLPVLTVMRKHPDLAKMRHALENVSRPERRWAMVERAGPIHRGEHGWFQCVGCDEAWAHDVLAMLTVEGNYPEPLRLAHVIGAGMVLGRSRSRA